MHIFIRLRIAIEGLQVVFFGSLVKNQLHLSTAFPRKFREEGVETVACQLESSPQTGV